MDVGLFSSCGHVTIRTRNVDPRAEGGARILIKESSIKAIEKCRDASSLEKSSTDKISSEKTGKGKNTNFVDSKTPSFVT